MSSINIIVLIIFGVILVVIAAAAILRSKTHLKVQRYQSRWRKYVPGEFSPQMELDLRLPYRRFRQLYPNSGLDYEDYKKLQMQRAFRRSLSSQGNKRMVR